MVNKSSANYYQKQRKAATKTRESYQSLSEEEKNRSGNMFVKNIKPFLNIKSKCWLSTEKKLIKCGKTLHSNTNKDKIL